MKRYLVATVLWSSLSVLSASAVEFEADILPMFKSKCGKCHMDGNAKGDLSLDAAEIEKVIGSGKAIVPGNPDKSDLVSLVSLPPDDEDHMPPQGKGSPLSAADVTKLKEWITAGAALKAGAPAPTTGGLKPTGMAAKRPDPIQGNWTNNAGKVITATLLRVEGTNAVLQMNGKEFPYPIANLSAGDQTKVREFDEATKKAAAGG